MVCELGLEKAVTGRKVGKKEGWKEGKREGKREGVNKKKRKKIKHKLQTFQISQNNHITPMGRQYLWSLLHRYPTTLFCC